MTQMNHAAYMSPTIPTPILVILILNNTFLSGPPPKAAAPVRFT